MDEDKSLEIASTLEDISEVLKRLMDFSNDLLEQFSETGLLTVETKKDFDSIMFECENNLKQADAILDSQELPM